MLLFFPLYTSVGIRIGKNRNCFSLIPIPNLSALFAVFFQRYVPYDSGSYMMYYLPCFFRDTYPMILVANKVDLVHLRKVAEEQGRDLAAQLKVSPYN